MARRVSKRSGICVPTTEVVLQALIDEWREVLCEGDGTVLICSFGTFTIKEVPARSYHYNRPDMGIDEIRQLPPKRQVKFIPTRNFAREVQNEKVDPTRKSFYRHPDDPGMRYRCSVRYKQNDLPVFKGRTKYEKKK